MKRLTRSPAITKNVQLLMRYATSMIPASKVLLTSQLEETGSSSMVLNRSASPLHARISLIVETVEVLILMLVLPFKVERML